MPINRAPTLMPMLMEERRVCEPSNRAGVCEWFHPQNVYRWYHTSQLLTYAFLIVNFIVVVAVVVFFVSVLWRLVRRKLFEIVSQERMLFRLASSSSNEQVPDQIAQSSDGRGRPFI